MSLTTIVNGLTVAELAPILEAGIKKMESVDALDVAIISLADRCDGLTARLDKAGMVISRQMEIIKGLETRLDKLEKKG